MFSRHFLISLLWSATATASAANAAQPALSLDEAIRRALVLDPQLKAEAEAINAARARVRQSGVRPNPELSAELENFAGTGGQRGLAGAELTVGLTQKLETGGKRNARITAAERAVDVASLLQAELRREVAAQTAAIYAEAASASKIEPALRDQIQDLNRIVGLLTRRAVAGAAPMADATRAQIDLARANADLAAAEATARAARERLALATGLRADSLGTTTLEGLGSGNVLAFERLESGLARHPRLDRLTAIQRERAAQLALETAQAAPDVTVGLGVRRREGEDDTGFVVSAAMPLQVFDANEGNIDAAKAELARSSADLDAARRKLAHELQTAVADYTANCDRARRLSNDVSPAARRVLAEVESGFAKGRMSALALLDAVTAKASAQVDGAAASAQCVKASVNLMALTGLHPASGKPATWLNALGSV